MQRAIITRLGWMIAFAACGGHASSGPGAAAPPIRATTPAPGVVWRDRTITTTGLPAIARDGSAVILAHSDSDGGRGNPNLTLLEKDRGDRVLARRVVLTAQEVDDLPAADVERRFAEANAWLGQRHRTLQLVPMTPLVSEQPVADEPSPAVGGGVRLRWSGDELALADAHGTLVRRATPASWHAADHPLCAACTEVCHNEAFLRGGYVDLARAALVVVIAYLGTDTCWEPSDQQHVIVW